MALRQSVPAIGILPAPRRPSRIRRCFLFYAENYADGYWTGVAYADHPLGPWKKDPRGRIFWGGHLAVFAGPDGRPWFSYRGEKIPAMRGHLCVDLFDIDKNGMMQCGEPSGTPVMAPLRKK